MGHTGHVGQDATQFAVERMTMADIPAVMAIEQKSFPMAWPERAYRYEISENPNAYFIVVRARPMGPTTLSTSAAPIALSSTSETASAQQPARQPHWFGRLFRRHQAQPAPAESSAVSLQGIATGASTVVGYAGMWMMVDEAHIATIASHPQWRGCGVGELLLVSMLDEAQRRHAIHATLEVRVSNVVAQRLYHKYEFEEVGRRKAYYQDNREDAFIYTVTCFQTPEYIARLHTHRRALMRRLSQAE